jgi:hypothetical protein
MAAGSGPPWSTELDNHVCVSTGGEAVLRPTEQVPQRRVSYITPSSASQTVACRVRPPGVARAVADAHKPRRNQRESSHALARQLFAAAIRACQPRPAQQPAQGATEPFSSDKLSIFSSQISRQYG